MYNMLSLYTVSAMPGQSKRYVMLQSLDLICDSEIERQLWFAKVCEDNLLIDGFYIAFLTVENIYYSQESSVFKPLSPDWSNYIVSFYSTPGLHLGCD